MLLSQNSIRKCRRGVGVAAEQDCLSFMIFNLFTRFRFRVGMIIFPDAQIIVFCYGSSGFPCSNVICEVNGIKLNV